MRYTAKTSFDHDGRTYKAGESVEVSEQTARELSARGLIDGYNDEGAKNAPPAQNKMQPEPNDRDRIVGGVGGDVGNRAGDVLAGEESTNVNDGTRSGKPRQTK